MNMIHVSRVQTTPVSRVQTIRISRVQTNPGPQKNNIEEVHTTKKFLYTVSDNINSHYMCLVILCVRRLSNI